MAHLKEIYINDGIISCLYSPEKNGEYGKVIYNNHTGEYSVIKTEYDKNTDLYSSVVLSKLRDMINENHTPSEYNLVFY